MIEKMILIAKQKIKIKENRIKNVELNAFIFGMASYRSSYIDIQSKHLNVIFNVIIIEIYFFFHYGASIKIPKTPNLSFLSIAYELCA